MDVLRITMSAHRHEQHTGTSPSLTSPTPSTPPSPTTAATPFSTTLGDSPSPSFTSLPPELAARSLSRLIPSWMSNALGGNNSDITVAQLSTRNHHRPSIPDGDAPPLPPVVELKRDSSLFSNLKGLGIFGGK